MVVLYFYRPGYPGWTKYIYPGVRLTFHLYLYIQQHFLSFARCLTHNQQGYLKLKFIGDQSVA